MFNSGGESVILSSHFFFYNTKTISLCVQILHSLFFLGKINPFPFTPEKILGNRKNEVIALFPELFQDGSPQLPRRSPFSCVLDMVRFIYFSVKLWTLRMFFSCKGSGSQSVGRCSLVAREGTTGGPGNNRNSIKNLPCMHSYTFI